MFSDLLCNIHNSGNNLIPLPILKANNRGREGNRRNRRRPATTRSAWIIGCNSNIFHNSGGFVLCKLYKKSYCSNCCSSKKKIIKKGIIEAIRNTPLIRINSLSQATGCEILGKDEFFNPGGSVKDRVSLTIIQEALNLGLLAKGGIVTEGSAGSTAISLATVAPACGCKFHAVIPDDAAIDKYLGIAASGGPPRTTEPKSESSFLELIEKKGKHR